MKTKVINLRIKFTTVKLIDRFYYFFRANSFNSQYVSFSAQFIIEGDNNVINLGKSTIVDVSNKNEIKSFIELACNTLLQYLSLNKKTKVNIIKINILYIECEEETYRENLRKTLQKRNFDLE